jgi:hypothetical protein
LIDDNKHFNDPDYWRGIPMKCHFIKYKSKVFFLLTLFFLKLVFLNCQSSGTRKISQEAYNKQVLELSQKLVNENFDAVSSLNDDYKNFMYIFNSHLNNTKSNLQLRSGTSLSIINRKTLDELQKDAGNLHSAKKLIIRTLFGGKLKQNREVILEEFILGTTRFAPWPFILPFQLKGKKFRKSKNNILGADFLNLTKSVLICRQGLLFFTITGKSSKILEKEMLKNGYKKICLIRVKDPNYFNIRLEGIGKLKNYLYLVPFVFNGKKNYMLLSTGNKFSIIHFSFAARSGARISQRNMGEFIDAANIRKKFSIIKYNSFSIGRFSLRKDFDALSTYFPQKNLHCDKGKFIKITGYLGTRFLIKHYAVIDFGNRALYLYLPDAGERDSL